MTELLEDINTAWENFCEGGYKINIKNKNTNPVSINPNNNTNTPKCSEIYISTKTIISYLNTTVDLRDVFWKIPIMSYSEPNEGIVKKQMKFNSSSQEEVDIISKLTETYNYVDNHIITRIVNPEGRIKFKDIRKVSIGLSKKDITSYKCKKKSAFYNCFVLEMRFSYEEVFKEIHVKVFNTGKLEIPGIKSSEILIKVLTLLTEILKPIISPTLTYVKGINETVLINSNFNCGYFINREKFYEILKYTYKMNSAYDPCSYPGIQCQFYYNPKLKIQTGRYPSTSLTDGDNVLNDITKMSFMVFRTGSVLIVGKCTEPVLYKIYEFLKNILKVEFPNIGTKIITEEMIKAQQASKTKRKNRKKIIIVTNNKAGVDEEGIDEEEVDEKELKKIYYNCNNQFI